MTLSHLALILGVTGLACFLWPIVRRIGGTAVAEPAGSGRSLRSPLWWTGFVLTAAAIYVQRMAAQQAAGL